MYKLYQGDCLEIMRGILDNKIDLVLTDPPYNIGCVTKKQGKKVVNTWDKVDNYIDWCVTWLNECCRILKPNGVLYFWHNDITQTADLLSAIKKETTLSFRSFCIWDKGNAYRAQNWKQRDPNGKTALRSWFNICEYCLHFFNNPKVVGADWKHTGLEMINSNPDCYQQLKQWYAQEKERLGISDADIAKKYTEVTGRKPYMLRHYFQNSQFQIPTKAVFEEVYEPLGFAYFENGKQGYEELRKGYESLRNYHRCDNMHCNIWHVPPIPTHNRYHTCQKPVEILERLIRVSCRPGGAVLDCFMGSGSTGVAALNTSRDFIGIELDQKYFQIAKERIEEAEQTIASGSPEA